MIATFPDDAIRHLCWEMGVRHHGSCKMHTIASVLASGWQLMRSLEGLTSAKPPNVSLESGHPASRPAAGFSFVIDQASTSADAITPWWKQQCRTPASQQKCWITSSTTCTVHEMCSRTAASSPNHGFRALENTFSPILRSTWGACSHGRRSFRILQPLLRVTPNACSSTAHGLSLRKREV